MQNSFPIISELVSISGFASSMQGGRPENQDDLGFLDTPLGFLFVLCDGMGGGPGGKAASFIVKQTIAKSLSVGNSLTSPIQALTDAFCKAQEALDEKMVEDPTLRGMGSTAVAVLINKDSAFVAHAGDSRCYYLSEGRMKWRSTDHSLVSELVQNKALTEEQARTSPQSNIITRALGATKNHTPDIKEISYQKGDRFILCTDGVWGSMPAPQLLQKFNQIADSSIIVNSLQDEVDVLGVQKGGGHDNHTIAIIDLKDHSQKTNNMIKRLKGIIAALASLAVVLMLICLVSIFSDRQSAEQEEAVANLAKQRDYYKNSYEAATKAINGNTKELITENVTLSTRVDSLINENSLLYEELDRMKIEMASLKAKLATHAPAKPNKVITNTNAKESKTNNRKLNVPSASSAENIKNDIVKNFENIIQCQKTDLKETVQYIGNQYNTITSKLTELHQKLPAGQQKIVYEVLTEINKEDNKDKVEKTRTAFQPTGVAKTFAKKCRDKIKEIKTN